MLGRNNFVYSGYQNQAKYWRGTGTDRRTQVNFDRNQLLTTSVCKWQIIAIVNFIVSVAVLTFAIYSVISIQSKPDSTDTTESTESVDLTVSCLVTVLPPGDAPEVTMQPSYLIELPTFVFLGGSNRTGTLTMDSNKATISILGSSAEGRLEFRVSYCASLYDMPDSDQGQAFFLRQLTTDEKTVIACLIGESDLNFGYVITWQQLVCDGVSAGTFQAILAITTQSKSYVIRSWSNDTTDFNRNQFQITYFDEAAMDVFAVDSSLVADDVKGCLVINSISDSFDFKSEMYPRVTGNEGCEVEMCPQSGQCNDENILEFSSDNN